MAHSVESFVDALLQDGVAAGQKAAEEIQREAQAKAAQIVRDAEDKARRIVEVAEKQRQQELERTRTDLELAARDTVARLRDTLSMAVNRLLDRAVSEQFKDLSFLKELISEIVRQYSTADVGGENLIDINVAESTRRELCDWAISTFHKPGEKRQLSVELHSTLAGAGFEYKVSGGTIEVTPESVVDVLSRIVTPELRELIASSTAADSGLAKKS